MSVCWMFMILLGCRLSHASESQSSCTCNYKVDYVCASHIVHVPCPNLLGEDKGYTLFKDEEMIYNHTWSNEIYNQRSNCTLNTSMGVSLCDHNKSVSFVLTGLNASSHGIYRCECTVTYPPPYMKESSALGILVLVKGHQCADSSPETPEVSRPVHGLHWIWISVTAVLSIYSIAVTIIAVVNYINFRHSDSQSDYMNTKPRAPKDRKKRGLENPIPRHF